MDPADLDTLAWRAVELAVQQRDDPRLIVATRATIPGPAATARLMAGLCNAAAGRPSVALFGIDGTGIVGLDEAPDDDWIDRITARFPGVVPVLAATAIDADGALVVALAVQDPGTLVVATRAGRAIIPWFDGTLADHPPTAQPSEEPPPAGVAVRSGWLERIAAATDTATGTGTGTPAEATAGTSCSGVDVWRGVLDVALTLPGGGRDEREHTADALVIDDRAVSVTLLADHVPSALSLDVQIHPAPDRGAVRTTTGVRVVAAVPCRLYLAAAVETPTVDRSGGDGRALRLLISVRLPGDDRLVATMVTLTPASGASPDAQALRWSC